MILDTNFNGVIIANQYDAMNRLTNQTSINGYQVSYTYTPTGQRSSMIDPSGTNSYTYDKRDRLLIKTVNWIGGPGIISLYYAYDANSNVTNLWSSTSGGVTNVYQYDALNRLTNVLASGSAAASYNFDGAGNLLALRYGNGVTNVYQYDSLNRLTNLVWKYNATTNASFYYQLGMTGNRTNLIESVNSANRTNSWSYDVLYRLTNEVIKTTITNALGYAYDSVGNRTNRTVTGGLSLTNQSFTFNTNDWLTGDSYDNNGNTTNSSSKPYQYDVENHLTNFNNGQVIITYDGDGNRASETVSGTTTYYLLDDRNPSGYVQVLAEYESSGLTRVYNYGLDIISQRQVSSASTNYFIYDGHGSTRLLTDIGGNVVNVFAYDAYGNLIASNTTPQTAYLYCGQQFDFNLGLYYNRARYLNPNTGRFWTMDTTEGDNEDPLSLHKYLYGEDNPVNNVDPLGLSAYLFFDMTGGPDWDQNAGHVGIGVDSGGKVLRRDAAHGSIGPLGTFTSEQNALSGDTIVAVFPDKMLADDKLSDDVIAQVLISGKVETSLLKPWLYHPWCSTYAAYVMEKGGYNLGAGIFPDNLLHAAEYMHNVTIQKFYGPYIVITSTISINTLPTDMVNVNTPTIFLKLTATVDSL